MHLLQELLIGICLLWSSALSAPQQVQCNVPPRYSDIEVGEPYALPPKMASGSSCNPNQDGGCELQLGTSYTVTVEESVSFSFAGELNLAEIFTAGLSAGYTIAWSTSDETSTTATVICPEADYTCGMMVKPIVVKITGMVSEYGPCATTSDEGVYPFEVVAPFREDDLPDNVASGMEFSACILECKDVEGCNKVMDGGLVQCPSDRAPGQWTNHFGGKPGYITLDEANENVEKIRDGEGQE